MTLKEKKVVKKFPYFYGRVLPKDRYEYGISSKNASWKQLSMLLSCLKIIEKDIINHIESIEPEMEIIDESDEDDS